MLKDSLLCFYIFFSFSIHFNKQILLGQVKLVLTCPDKNLEIGVWYIQVPKNNRMLDFKVIVSFSLSVVKKKFHNVLHEEAPSTNKVETILKAPYLQFKRFGEIALPLSPLCTQCMLKHLQKILLNQLGVKLGLLHKPVTMI